MADREMQQYLFDLNGYLIIKDVLGADEVDALNRLIDRQNLPPPAESTRFGSAPTLASSLIERESAVPESMARADKAAPAGSGFLDWGKPFCDLLDHPAIMPVLRMRLGDAFRLDRLYGMNMSQGMAYGVLHADYGASAPQSDLEPGEYYAFRANQIYEGFVVVAWALADGGGELGGFCCIPGSHKSHYKLPRRIREQHDLSPAVVIPEMRAGSVILFTESLTHGTATWHGQHERRALLYKYCVSHLAWTSKRVEAPASVELSPRQQILLRDPGDPLRHFSSLFEGAPA